MTLSKKWNSYTNKIQIYKKNSWPFCHDALNTISKIYIFLIHSYLPKWFTLYTRLLNMRSRPAARNFEISKHLYIMCFDQITLWCCRCMMSAQIHNEYFKNVFMFANIISAHKLKEGLGGVACYVIIASPRCAQHWWRQVDARVYLMVFTCLATTARSLNSHLISKLTRRNSNPYRERSIKVT